MGSPVLWGVQASAEPAADPPGEYVAGRLMVGFEQGTSGGRRADVHRQNGASVLKRFEEINVDLVRLPPDRGVGAGRSSYQRAPGVAFADPDYIRRSSATTPNDPSFSQQWAHRNTGLIVNGDLGTADADIDSSDLVQDAWSVTTGSTETVVAVVDSGIQITHPDLTNNIWVNSGEIPGNGIDDDGNGYIDDINGWDFASDDNTVWDSGQKCGQSFNDDHGTHVAGILGAVGDNGVGVAGVNWTTRIMALKFLTKAGGTCGNGADSDAVDAILYATRMGADVINASWGGSGYNEALKQAIIAAGRGGVLISVAAGNSGQNLAITPDYPSSFDLANEIIVAASNNDDGLASFSNYGGPTELAAPGVNIYSTIPDNTYAYFSGTSMAAPFVTGAVALLKAQYPQASAVELKARILETVDLSVAFATNTRTRGRLNLNSAIRQDRPVVPTVVTPNGGEVLPVGTVKTIAWDTNIPSGNALKAYRIEYTTNALFSTSESTGFETSIPAGWTEPADSDLPWSRTDLRNHSGSWSLVAPAALEGNQGAWITTTKNFSAPGTVSFWWRVDSENCESGPQPVCGDYFRFHLDGYPLVAKAGFQEWTFATFNVPAGVHELSWSYHKDPLDTVGEDTAWIDDVQITGLDAVSWTQVATTAVGATNFDWTVPNTETTSAKVRVCENTGSACSASAADASDGVFSIFIPTPGITLSHTGGSTAATEGGAVDSYTVVLETQPTAEVTISISSSSQLNRSPSPLTFTPANWSTPQTVSVSAVDDLLDEDSPMTVSLLHTASSSGTDYNGKTASIDVSVIDGDPTPSLSITDVSVTEGNSGAVNAVFSVSLSAASGRTVSMNYGTQDGSATQPADYTATSSSLSFAPGETAKTITVVVKADTIDELAETFFVNLSNATNAGIADSQGIATIINDDPEPSLSLNDVSVAEGNSGTVSAAFNVILSAPSGKTVSVNYATAADTATSGTDFTVASGGLTFSPGQTIKTVTVPVIGDTFDEFDETFLVNLSGATNATIADFQSVGTIIDDDSAPSISVNDVTLLEGNSGLTDFVFTVSLSGGSGKSIPVNYATSEGAATAPGDYSATSGSLTFDPGQTSKQIAVTVVGDTVAEPDEEFYLDLSGAVNATITDPRGVATILDDDTPGVAIVQSGGTTKVRETGATSDTYQVFLRAAPTLDVVVSVVPNSQITFSPASLTFTPSNWSTPQTVTLTAVDDPIDEALAHFATLAHSLASGDARYDGFAAPLVTIEITDNDESGYWVDARGSVQRFGDAVSLSVSSLPRFDFDIARGIAALPGNAGGYVLDGFGGMHPFAPSGVTTSPLSGAPYFPGFDIARKLTLRPAGGGYFLDGWGGVHPGGGAPSITPGTLPYFPGHDIARSLVLLPSGQGGYLLDGFGGLHPFGIGGFPAPVRATGLPYFSGSDIARDVVLLPDAIGGYILDGFGGIHAFGAGSTAPPAAGGYPYTPGQDKARGLLLVDDASGGYVIDSSGAIKTFRVGANPLPPLPQTSGGTSFAARGISAR